MGPFKLLAVWEIEIIYYGRAAPWQGGGRVGRLALRALSFSTRSVLAADSADGGGGASAAAVPFVAAHSCTLSVGSLTLYDCAACAEIANAMRDSHAAARIIDLFYGAAI